MKSFLSTFFLFFVLSLAYAQPDLNSSEWQEDLRYLQHKVHSDYPFLFHKVTSSDFDSAVEDLYERIPQMQDHEVVVGIAQIVALFEYGHTALWLTSWRYNRLVDFHQMPYNLYAFTEGIHIQGVHRDYEEALGAKVVGIGNKSIDEALELVRPVVSAENDQFFKAHGLNYLGVPEVLHAVGIIDKPGNVTLTLEKNGKQFAMEFSPRPSGQFPGKYGLVQTNGDWLDAAKSDRKPLWLSHLEKKYFFEYLEDQKTVYVRQSEVQDDDSESIADFYNRVFDFIDENEVGKLVLDLRLNSGGNNYKNKPVIQGLIRSDKINHPGGLIVILGRRTFSACQNLVNEIENYTDAIFVGEATAENVNFFGDSRTERLPNSDLSVRLSYLWWQDKDPRDNRPWTPPHVAIDLSFEDYQAGHDPVMETIFKSKQLERSIDPWSHLTDLFIAGDVEKLMTKAVEYVSDPQYRYFDFESRINDAGYQLLGQEQFEQAIFAFQMNAELFPNSANCWDSLAEAHWRSGNNEKAVELYTKAIEMDPQGPTGQNARTMLARIQGKGVIDHD